MLFFTREVDFMKSVAGMMVKPSNSTLKFIFCRRQIRLGLHTIVYGGTCKLISLDI